MLKLIALFSAVVVASTFTECNFTRIQLDGPKASQGVDVDTSSRHGNMNLYFMYTRNNPRDPIQMSATQKSIELTNFGHNPSRTVVIVHGHDGSAFTSLNPVVKDALLSSQDVNVIVVDWSVYAGQSYSNAVSAVPGAGVALGQFLHMLAASYRISYSSLHLVGFGLGAHIVGFAGRTLYGQVARITGLDPSASQWGSNSQRLRASDARYVEVIHTDGDGLGANGLGTALGHVDFFANGGGNQPGCVLHSCSHNRAWQLFAATLTHSHLIGNLCESNLQLNLNRCRGYALAMGNNDVGKYGSGIFRVNTRRTYPY